jgi:GNAT superfamily N-acetyltransferase
VERTGTLHLPGKSLAARLATMADVAHIGLNMWDRGRDELGSLGVRRDQWVDDWRMRIARGDAVMFGTHALLGWDWVAPREVETRFQAARSFESHGIGRAVTKAMRDAIPRLMREHGVRHVRIYSLCIEPSAAKWFRLLGFCEDTHFNGALFGRFTMRKFFREI